MRDSVTVDTSARVMIVDAEAERRAEMARGLSRADVITVEAGSHEEAHERLRAWGAEHALPALVLIATDLPNPRADTFIAELAGDPRTAEIATLRLGAPAERDRVTALNLVSGSNAPALEQAFEAATNPILIADIDGFIEWVNRAFVEHTGYTREEAVGRRPADLVKSGRQDEAFYADLWATIRSGRNWRGEIINRRKDGSECVELMSISPITDDEGRITRFIAIKQDISEQKRTQQEAQRLAQRLSHTLESITDGFYTLDADWHFTYVNAAAERVLQRRREALIGCVLWDTFPDVVGTELEAQFRRAMETGETREFELHYPPLAATFDIRAYPGSKGLAVYFRDVTEARRAHAEITFLTLYDPLTHLPNRQMAVDRLGQALSSAAQSGRCGAVLYLDLNGFKKINDVLGHATGDCVLQYAADRLRAHLSRRNTVARLGADEFLVVLDDLAPDTDEASERAWTMAQELKQVLAEPYYLAESTQHITASIGISVFDGHTTDSDALLREVDMAVHAAKAGGGTGIDQFRPEMSTALASQVQLEGEIREGLPRGEFVPWYQPQIDADGRIIGCEALARWQHPERGLISPGLFIPTAEDSELIEQIGRVMLDSACRRLAAWAHDPNLAGLDVAVNVSPRQFHRAEFLEEVRGALTDTGADPGRLWLEVTENLLLRDLDDTVEKMDALRAEGVRFSLDDFGTGYASLTYLKRLPFDLLKIDQSFVRGMLEHEHDTAIVRMIIALAGSMDLPVLAEGVETTGLHRALAREGCQQFQGFLFGRPMPVEDFEVMVREHVQAKPGPTGV